MTKKGKKTYKRYEDEFNYYTNGKVEATKTTLANLQHLYKKEKDTFESKFSKPKNESQTKYVSYLNNINNRIIIASGPAGTGKTLFATEYGLKQFMLMNYEKIVFTRPAVNVDEELGYLPGTLEDKLAPYMRPIYDILYKLMSPEEVKNLIEQKIIEISPLAYMRGRTFKNTWIIADEMQNCTVGQMKMLLTRMGENSRMVITGDLEQQDRGIEINGLYDFLEKFKGRRSSSISSVEFNTTDIERDDVVKEVLEIYGGCVPESYIGITAQPSYQPLGGIKVDPLFGNDVSAILTELPTLAGNCVSIKDVKIHTSPKGDSCFYAFGIKTDDNI